MQEGNLYIWVIAAWLAGMLVIVLIDSIKDSLRERPADGFVNPQLLRDVFPEESKVSLRRVFD
jgi:hypothetical protein